MLRALILAVGLTSVMALAARADDEQKPKREKPTAEQKALRKEITEKYDKDKDGKLSPDERKGISAEDKEKMQKAGLGPRKKKKE